MCWFLSHPPAESPCQLPELRGSGPVEVPKNGKRTTYVTGPVLPPCRNPPGCCSAATPELCHKVREAPPAPQTGLGPTPCYLIGLAVLLLCRSLRREDPAPKTHSFSRACILVLLVRRII